MRNVCFVLLAIFLCRAARAEDVAPLYDLRVRLRVGDAYSVRHNGEVMGATVVNGQKNVSSVKGDTKYEIRVLNTEKDAAKVRLTFRSDETRGTSGGVTVYAPFSAVIEKPTRKTSNGDAIRGQSVYITISSIGDVTGDILEPPFAALRRYQVRTTEEGTRGLRELAAFELKRQTLQNFCLFIGARPLQPVAVGTSWRGQFALKSSYRTRRFEVSYTLTKVEKDVASLATSTRELPENSRQNAMSNMKEKSWNAQNGTLQIALKNGWPLRAEENGQIFSQLQTVENKTTRNVLTTYGKSRSQVETTALSSLAAPR